MSKGFSTEITHKIFDESTGEHIEVGTDADTGELLEVRQVEGSKTVARVVGQPEQLRLVALAILELVGKESPK
jgi:hypothetical protein